LSIEFTLALCPRIAKNCNSAVYGPSIRASTDAANGGSQPFAGGVTGGSQRLRGISPPSTSGDALVAGGKDLEIKRSELDQAIARAGEDFAKLAGEFSEDSVSRGRGGEYQFPHGKMVPEVEAAAFALKTNEISGLVTSAYGYHIIKLSEKIPAHKIKYADADAEIKRNLIQQAIEQQFPDYIARLRQEAAVEILEEKLKPQETMGAEFPPPGPRTQPDNSPPTKQALCQLPPGANGGAQKNGWPCKAGFLPSNTSSSLSARFLERTIYSIASLPDKTPG
jgi:hypothetical protein